MNNLPFTIGLLNKNDPLEIKSLERASFDAFTRYKDRTQETIFNFDESEQRMTTKIPYNDMEIMTVRFNDSIVSGTALNFNMSEKLQLEYFGFRISKNEPFICEGLYLFNIYSNLNDLFFLLSAFRKNLFEYLVSQNIKKVYATCSQKRLRNYRFLGFKDIDMKLVNGQKKYLLIINV